MRNKKAVSIMLFFLVLLVVVLNGLCVATGTFDEAEGIAKYALPLLLVAFVFTTFVFLVSLTAENKKVLKKTK